MRRYPQRTVGKYLTRGSNRYTASMLRPRLRARATTALVPRGRDERKFLDTDPGEVTAGATGTIHSASLCVIPQNATQSGRDGRLVTIKSLRIKGYLELQAATSTANASDFVRVIVYVDKQTNGAAATPALILANDPSNAAVTTESFRNLENVDRFDILYDKTFGMTSPVSFAAAGATPTVQTPVAVLKNIKMSKKLNLPIVYDSTLATGAIETIRSNNIGILTVSALGRINCGFVARVRYSDK